MIRVRFSSSTGHGIFAAAAEAAAAAAAAALLPIRNAQRKAPDLPAEPIIDHILGSSGCSYHWKMNFASAGQAPEPKNCCKKNQNRKWLAAVPRLKAPTANEQPERMICSATGPPIVSTTTPLTSLPIMAPKVPDARSLPASEFVKFTCRSFFICGIMAPTKLDEITSEP
jgi:hypothetical protein